MMRFPLLSIFTVAAGMILSVLSAGEPQECYLRVTVLETEPKVPGTLTSLLSAEAPPSVHVFRRKAVFGTGAKTVESKTGFHDVIDWDSFTELEENKIGTPTAWVNISDVIYAPHRPESGWFKNARKYARTTLHLGFFSRENDHRKDRRPIFKRLEAGNLDCVKVRVDFATRPEESAVFYSVTETAHWGVLGFRIDAESPDKKIVISMLEWLNSLEKKMRAEGFTEQPLPVQTMIAGREYAGYFSPLYSREAIQTVAILYRLLGFTSVQYSTKDTSEQFLSEVWWENDPIFTEGTRPDWVAGSPADPELLEKSRRAGAKISVIAKTRLVKCGDETKILDKKTLSKPEVKKMFVSFLKERQISPEIFGVSALDDVPFTESPASADTPEKRRAYYYTSIFRSEAMLQWYKQFIGGMKSGYSGKMLITGEICWENRDFPDILRAFELGVYDVAAHECATMLWIMPHGALFRLISQRSGARYSTTLPGILYAGERGRNPDIMELDGTSALIQGMRLFYWYDTCLFATKDFSYYRNQKKLNDRFSRYENAIIKGNSLLKAPPALVIKSYAGEIWQKGIRDPKFQEFEMTVAALAWNQIAFDILNDDMAVRHLDNYKIVYLTSPVLPSASREPLLKWVKNGGILVLVGNDTAIKNEFNEPDSLNQKLSLMLGAKGLRVKDYGKGKVCRIAGTPGKDLRNSFQPSDKDVPYQHVFHRIGRNDVFRYAEPFRFLPETARPVLCDRAGIDAGLYESPQHDSALLILADYTDSQEKPITFRLLLRGSYTKAIDENGQTYAVKKEGKRLVLQVPVKISAIYTLEK